MTARGALRLLGGAAVVLWGAFTVSFAILYLLPSDPVSIMLSQSAESLDPAQVQALRERHGLDRPLPEQYLTQLGNALTGDLGTSVTTGAPVTDLLAEALPHTAALAGLALLLAVLAGTGIAVLASWTRARWLRAALLALPPVGVAVPGFWVGLVLLQLFSFTWYVFPAVGQDGFASLVLPAVTLAVPLSATIAQVLARGLDEAWRAPYADTAFGAGASRNRVLGAHVLRNGSLPTVTLIGVLTGNLLGGTVVVETVFSRQGLGRLAEQAVTTQDIPVVQGLVLTGALVFVVAGLLADLAHPLLDPRLRGRRAAPAPRAVPA
ncbi:ABC transporter permease [Myceligenerans crystallogenes]|uniref:ABC transporter permease n=1 Tax=Myceligenerans crystallogenes TaxID=316335 RepID=A0ABN2N9L0_9MICO